MVNKYIERVGQAIITVFLVITLTFGMIRLLPGGPMDYLRAQLIEQMGSNVDMDRVNRLVESITNVNPDKPLYIQYVDYMTSILTGDLGKSMWYGAPVTEIIADALPWTLFLMSLATLLTFGIGIILGAIMAYNEGSRFDVTTSVTSILLTSIPYFLVAILVLYVAGYMYGWFPTGGRMNQDTTVGFNWPFIAGVLNHAALPLFSVVITGFGGWALNMRGNSIRTLGEDYLRVARLRGLPPRHIALRYVGRNAILPMYTGLMIGIGFLFGGAVILEEIFSYKGIGYFLYASISSRDYPLMMGSFLVITIAVVIGILVADLTYHKIDPRAGGENREAY